MLSGQEGRKRLENMDVEQSQVTGEWPSSVHQVEVNSEMEVTRLSALQMASEVGEGLRIRESD